MLPRGGRLLCYAREALGHDYGFLTSWFLILTYLAMLWANATALPLFAHYFLGDIFEFGHMYTLFGYDVYFGEAILSVAAIAIVALSVCLQRKVTAKVMVVLVGFFAAAVTICFVVALTRHGPGAAGEAASAAGDAFTWFSFDPLFAPGSGAFSQVVKIACISPWAFIGFESVSHAAEEFSFKRTKTFRVLATAVVSATLLYIFITVLSASAYPARYAGWTEYIRDIGNLSGIEALPAFYAARYYMGQAGVWLLMIALLALIVTSLIGNIMALSRLFFSMSRDRIIAERFGKLNRAFIPRNAVLLIAGVSLVIPFLGRTAIGWIVDVTTLGATIVYMVVSGSARRTARLRGDRTEIVTGTVGLVVMIGFLAYLLVPNLFTAGSMETASNILFVVWALLGFLFFRRVLKRDEEKRFGQSVVVWLVLLSLILFVSLVWMSRSTMDATGRALNELQQYYVDAGFQADQSGIIQQELDSIRRANAGSILAVIGLFVASLAILMNNLSLMRKKAAESENRLGAVMDIASRDPLTGVKSKLAYAEKEQEVNTAVADGTAGPFALVVCDVNGLKMVNDTYGHKAGDEYIKSACRMVCKIFQHSPVYRTGGDEFVVYLSGGDYDLRLDLMYELHAQSVERIATGEAVVAAGLSEFVPGEDTGVRAVFERADAWMYEEKRKLKEMGAPTRA
ncbi:MAG: amino acid permease [Lachnospiraceae bacterium]|nr:amino acid permease [Lachnospiraceae bacterium]